MTGRRVSGWLLRRIPEVVAEPRWCGGLSRADLAGALHVREFDRVFEVSLWACYRRGLVDLCSGYVVVPAPGGAAQEGTRS